MDMPSGSVCAPRSAWHVPCERAAAPEERERGEVRFEGDGAPVRDTRGAADGGRRRRRRRSSRSASTRSSRSSRSCAPARGEAGGGRARQGAHRHRDGRQPGLPAPLARPEDLPSAAARLRAVRRAASSLENDEGANDTFLIRRARPILEGTLFDVVDFRLMPDFGGSGTSSSATATLQDAWVNFRPWTARSSSRASSRRRWASSVSSRRRR